MSLPLPLVGIGVAAAAAAAAADRTSRMIEMHVAAIELLLLISSSGCRSGEDKKAAVSLIHSQVGHLVLAAYGY